MKYKIFYISIDGKVSKHKMRSTMLAGFGMLWEDQVILAQTYNGKQYILVFEDVKVGGHEPNVALNLDPGDSIKKIDVVTKK